MSLVITPQGEICQLPLLTSQRDERVLVCMCDADSDKEKKVAEGKRVGKMRRQSFSTQIRNAFTLVEIIVVSSGTNASVEARNRQSRA